MTECQWHSQHQRNVSDSTSSTGSHLKTVLSGFLHIKRQTCLQICPCPWLRSCAPKCNESDSLDTYASHVAQNARFSTRNIPHRSSCGRCRAGTSRAWTCNACLCFGQTSRALQKCLLHIQPKQQHARGVYRGLGIRSADCNPWTL